MTPPLSEIIERVERATGPDRELDAVIGRAIGLDVRAEFAEEAELGDWFIGPPRECGSWMEQDVLPAYTSSLDAALTLVAEGAGIDLRRYWIARSDSPVWSCALYWGNGHSCDTDDRPSAALAVCLVSLRARLATQEQQG